MKFSICGCFVFEFFCLIMNVFVFFFVCCMKKLLLLCVGIGGFVGFGKIMLFEMLCKVMCDCYDFVVIINDIYMKED